MNFKSKHFMHSFLLSILSVALLSFYSCERKNQLVNPFEPAKIKLQLIFPESTENSTQKYEAQVKSTTFNKKLASALAFDNVTVSVLDSATRNIIINQQELTITGNVAEGELNIPVIGDRQTFIIIVFASDTEQLQFLVGSENVQLEPGEVRVAPVVIVLQLPTLLASRGSVQASSTFPDGNFAPQLTIDFDFSTSWFSAGQSVDGNTSTFTWTSSRDEFVTSAGIVNNSNHFDPTYQSGYGFETVTFQVYSGPNATENLLFEETVDYPKSTQLPVASVAPFVEGRSIRLLLNNHENPERGGFSELLIVGMSFASEDNPVLQSISVTPVNSSISVGQTQQFTATGMFSDGATSNISNEVTWQSGNTSVATISTTGLATGVSPGTSTITASQGEISGQTTLTVNPATLVSIAVTPVDSSITVGQNLQFTAMGTFSDSSTKDITKQVTWASSDEAVATISSSGLATGNAGGTTTISAEQEGVIGRTSLTVTSLAGAIISSLNFELLQLNDSTSCNINGSIASLYRFEFDYTDQNGDVTPGTIINVSFEFQPSGTIGSFDVSSPVITGDGFQGTLAFFACYFFASDSTVRITVSITDAGNRVSNAISTAIQRPEGANSPPLSQLYKIEENGIRPSAGIYKKP